MATATSSTAERHPTEGGEASELTIILDQTRETLELVRSLVALLLPRENGDGPKLEDLIAALVAQQRDMIVAIKRLQGDVTADRRSRARRRDRTAGWACQDKRNRPGMMNFRKIAAASKGRLLLRYFTENTPEPIHPAAGGRSRAPARRGRAADRLLHGPRQPGDLAAGHAGDPRTRRSASTPEQMPRDAEMSRLFEARRADTGEAWSQHNAQALRLRPGVQPAQIGQPRGRVRRHAGGERRPLERRRSRRRPGHALRGPGPRLGAQRRRRRGWRRPGRGRLDQLPPSHGPAHAADAGRIRRADLPVRCAGRRRPAYARPQLSDEPGGHGGRPRSARWTRGR